MSKKQFIQTIQHKFSLIGFTAQEAEFLAMLPEPLPLPVMQELLRLPLAWRQTFLVQLRTAQACQPEVAMEQLQAWWQAWAPATGLAATAVVHYHEVSAIPTGSVQLAIIEATEFRSADQPLLLQLALDARRILKPSG